jgi:flagellar protein FlbB
MKNVSERAKILYLVVLILFISAFGFFWLDHIGLISLQSKFAPLKKEPKSVLYASGDEPSLVEKEEFDKERQLLLERIEELNRREALISEKEKEIETEKEKIAEIKKGLDLEKKKFDNKRTEHAGYMKNIKDLAFKMANMPPDQSVNIMINWEETLIIDVLRQMDRDSAGAGQASITPYLLTLMPKEKAGRITYLMTQI